MERKFKRGVSRPGMAAQLRETVSQVVKETTIETQRHITEPLDYENYVIANMTILRNDPHRELLLFPLDDIQVCDRDQANPYLGTRLEQRGLEMADALPLRVCLETYTARLVSVKYNYDAYAGTYLQLPKFPLAPQLPQGVSELSMGDTQTVPSESSAAQTLSKCGFLLRAPDTADRLFAKAYKRRFAKLRQGADGTYVLEFYKDSKLSENKGAIPLDLITEVVKLPRRNKPSFELRTAADGKTYVLATETDQELTSWLDAVTKAVVSNREDRLSILSDVSSGRECTPPVDGGDAASVCCDTLRGLDQTLNPQLLRYAHETDFQTAHARAEDRVCVFQLYPHVAVSLFSVKSKAIVYYIHRCCF